MTEAILKEAQSKIDKAIEVAKEDLPRSELVELMLQCLIKFQLTTTALKHL